MSTRFFVNDLLSQATVSITGQEAAHIARVMRKQIGDQLTLFDGQGHQANGEILKVERQSVSVSVGRVVQISRETDQEIILGVAWPKTDRPKYLIEKLTEIGVAELVPLVTGRSEAKFRSMDKLNRSVIEASKQCGRNRLMKIGSQMALNDFLARPGQDSQNLMLHPGHDFLGTLPLAIGRENRAVWLAIGPEGGFTDEEIETAHSAGWKLASLGPRIMRIETAAIVAASWAMLTGCNNY